MGFEDKVNFSIGPRVDDRRVEGALGQITLIKARKWHDILCDLLFKGKISGYCFGIEVRNGVLVFQVIVLELRFKMEF